MIDTKKSLINHAFVRAAKKNEQYERMRWQNFLQGLELVPSGMPPTGIFLINNVNITKKYMYNDNQLNTLIKTEIKNIFRNASRPANGTVLNNADSLYFIDIAELIACYTISILNGFNNRQWWWHLVFDKKVESLPGKIKDLWLEHINFIPAAVVKLLQWNKMEILINKLPESDLNEILLNLCNEFRIFDANKNYHQNKYALTQKDKIFDKSHIPVFMVHYKKELQLFWSKYVSSTIKLPDDITGNILSALSFLICNRSNLIYRQRFLNQLGSLLSTYQILYYEDKTPGQQIEKKMFQSQTEFKDKSTIKEQGIKLTNVKKQIKQKDPTNKKSNGDKETLPDFYNNKKPISPENRHTSLDIGGNKKGHSIILKKLKFGLNKEFQNKENIIPQKDFIKQEEDDNIYKNISDLNIKKPKIVRRKDNKTINQTDTSIDFKNNQPNIDNFYLTCDTHEIYSKFCSLFFIIPLIQSLELFPDTNTRFRIINHCTGWIWFEMIIRSLLAKTKLKYSNDPIWKMLSLINNNETNTSSLENFVDRYNYYIPSTWYIPELKTTEKLKEIQYKNRYLLIHPANFIMADVLKKSDKFKKLVNRYGLANLQKYKIKKECELQKFLPGYPYSIYHNEPLSRFLNFVLSYIIMLLEISFPRDNKNINSILSKLFYREGYIYYSTTHIDIVMKLDDVDMDVRMSGLDCNPGWIPYLCRVFTFYYQ